MQKPLLLTLLAGISSAAAVPIFVGPLGYSEFEGEIDFGLEPRFGLIDDLEEPVPVPGTTDTAQNITGDPTRSFTDLASNPFILLDEAGVDEMNNPIAMKAGDIISFSYEIFIPETPANAGITSTNAQLRFYGDAGEPGLQFGAGGDFVQRINRTGNGNADTDENSIPDTIETRGVWQKVSLNTTVPSVDNAGIPISHFAYAIQLPQAGETSDPDVNGEPDQMLNDIEGPVNLFIRNIDINFTPLESPEPGTFFRSPQGTGFIERFGLFGALGSVPGSDELSYNITGDPLTSFADYYSGGFFSLESVGLNAEDAPPVRFSYEIYIPSGEPGITDSNARIRFYSDRIGEGREGILDFGAESEFTGRVDINGGGADLSIVDEWQTVTAEGLVPEFDNSIGADRTISHFQFNITLPQAGEDRDGDVNSIEAPVNVFIRNILLIFPQEAEPTSSFTISDVTYDAATEEVSVTFPSEAGQTFTIESSTTLTGFAAVAGGTVSAADAPATSTTFTQDAGGAGRLFYRVTRN